MTDEQIQSVVKEDEYLEMLKEEIWIQKYLLIQQSKNLGIVFQKEDFSLADIQIFTEIQSIINKHQERSSKHGQRKTSL